MVDLLDLGSPTTRESSKKRIARLRAAAKPPIRDLIAGWELRAVAVFGIAAAQGLDLCAIALELASGLTQSLGSSAAASHRVLGEGALVEEDAGMTPPDGHGLSLAVCRQERPVLGL
jgi:hypothetical protein